MNYTSDTTAILAKYRFPRPHMRPQGEGLMMLQATDPPAAPAELITEHPRPILLNLMP